MTEKIEKLKTKRIISVFLSVISAIIFVLVGLLLVNIIVCRSQNRPVNFFGYSFSVVQTNSMEPEIMTGDLIVFKKVEFSSLKEGDNIVFKADNNFKDGAGISLEGYTIVHQIIRVSDKGLITKGVNNFAEDGGFRSEADIYGLCVSNSAGWGKVFTFLGKYGALIIIFIIAVPVIVTQTIKIIKLSKKKEQGENDEINSSSADITVESVDDK